MTRDLNRLRTTLEQMDRLIRAVDDLRENVLPKDPKLFATMVEGPLQDLARLREEVRDSMEVLQPTA